MANTRRCHRFIPAGAGNTPPRRSRRRRTAVHPRGRGEHNPRLLERVHAYGSSPRARGTHRTIAYDAVSPRFIPAGAGNTAAAAAGYTERSVHPRGRGEHGYYNGEEYHRFGSSPRARGTQVRRKFLFDLNRFIPAGAGNTRSVRRGRAVGAVHPRGRGEHRTTG